MKTIQILVSAAALFSSVAVHAAALTPLTATGWNQDIVIGAGDTLSGHTATMDGGNSGTTWYGVGFNGAAPASGLPVGITASQSTPADLTFNLQPFGLGGVPANNAIYNGGTLTLTTPTLLQRLALIGSSGHGPADITVTVTYADSSTQIFGPGGVGGGVGGVNTDWFGTAPLAYTANGRVDVGNGVFDQVNNNLPRLFQSVFTLTNTTSPVTSVTITDGGGGDNAIMAVSGEVIPEPSTAALGLLGGAVTLAMRRRRA